MAIPTRFIKTGSTVTGIAEFQTGETIDPIWLPSVFSNYISGLSLEWISATAIRVNMGSCYLPSLGYIVNINNAITKTGLSLAASTTYHVYLYLNGASFDVEIVTTAPSAPYIGTARTKTGDTSRRYIGSVVTDSTTAIMNFYHEPNSGRILYKMLPGRPITAGTATTITTVSCALWVPLTSRIGIINHQNLSGVGVRILSSDGSYAGTDRLYGINAGQAVVAETPLNSSQAYQYYLTAANTGTGYTAELTGYTLER